MLLPEYASLRDLREDDLFKCMICSPFGILFIEEDHIATLKYSALTVGVYWNYGHS